MFSFYKVITQGVLLYIYVNPGAKLKTVSGFYVCPDGQQYLKVEVTEQPEKGLANKSIIDTLSNILSIPKKYISIAHGLKSRKKIILIQQEKKNLLPFLKEWEKMNE